SLRSEPFFLDDAIEHLAGVVIERARDLADFFIVENHWKAPGQLPGLEEWGPVDVVGEFGEVVGLKALDAKERRLLRRRLGKIDLPRIGAGLSELQPLLLGLGAEMRGGNL